MTKGIELNLDSDNLSFSINATDTITFMADEIIIGADFLALKFKEMPLNLEGVKKLIFQNMDGSEIHVFKKL